MAGIFNLFGEISEPDKGLTIKPLSRSKTSVDINTISIKNLGLSKPKGLSIRSNSDLNVPASVQDISNKQQELWKLKPTKSNTSDKLISPRKDLLPKKLIGLSNKLNNVSPKKVFDKKNAKLPSNETVFKKPFTPKRYNKKSYPEPESLAPYYDIQSNFDDFYTILIENEFKELLLKKRNKVEVYQDEGFHSDPEQIDLEVPKLCMSPIMSNEEGVQYKIPDLPEISDDDNF